jgi:hypothetical protein
MQAYLFVSAIELVVRFGETPDQFFVELKPLIIRHIKYGVKSEVCTRIYVMYVCMYVSLYVCMYVCMYVRISVCIHVDSQVPLSDSLWQWTLRIHRNP